jgi:hypothetical protein
VTTCLSAFRFDACVMGGVSLIVRDILNSPADWQARSVEKEKTGVASIVRRGE